MIKYIIAVMVVLVAHPAFSQSITLEDAVEVWHGLEPEAKDYYDYLYEEHTNLALSKGVHLDADEIDGLTRDVVYHQLYATVKCAIEHGLESPATTICTEDFIADFLRGANVLSDVHMSMPAKSLACLNKAWLVAEQVRFPPFDIIKHDNTKLRDWGIYIDCITAN